MFGKSRNPKALATGATLMTLALVGTGVALAKSESLQSSTALTAPGEAMEQSVYGGFADIVESVRPAVVNIEVTRKAGSRMSMEGEGQNPEEFFKRYFDEEGGEGPSREFFERWFREFGGPRGERQGPMQQPMQAAGSGFIIDPEGIIVTNNHVVAGGDEIRVIMSDGREFEAELIGRDAATDLAVISIDAGEVLPFVAFGDSDATRVGDWVITIGNPFGLENSVTTGIVSARGRSIGAGRYDDFLQIDAPINRGNSGGPAFNTRGEVIGVNTAIFSPSGGSVGIGFAIPSDMVQEIVAELREDGSVERGWLGVHIQPVTEDLAEGLELKEAKGAVVAEVTDDSPAAAAELQAGDVIVEVDGKPVGDARDLTRMIARIDPGETAKLGLWRDGERREVSVELGTFPEADQMASLGQEGPTAEGESVMGMGLAKLDPEARAAFRIDEDTDGVVITDVEPDSWAARKGIRPGDVIVQAGLEPVSSPADVMAAVESAKKKDRKNVLVLVSREQLERFVTLPLQDV